jgi:hypothetical protein
MNMRLTRILLVIASARLAGSCEFADDGRSDLVVSCDALFSVAFSRANGALTGLFDAAGRKLSAGSRNGCLFGAADEARGTYCGSCGCDGVDIAFSYSWRAASSSLELRFAPSPANASSSGWSSTVTLTARPQLGPVFDLALTLVAGPGSGAGYSELLFPSELLFDTANLSAMHLAITPGVSLLPPFFAKKEPTQWTYPSSFAFASWAQIDLFGGSAALVVHDLSGPDVVVPVRSFAGPAGGKYNASSWYLGGSIPVNLTVGCEAFACAVGANGSVTRRFVLASQAPSPLESIRAYALANGMLAGGDGAWSSPPYPTIRQKLAAVSPTFWRQAFAAPLLKLDSIGVGLPFADYESKVLPNLPSPALLHLCAFERCGSQETPGFDCGYPDILPPATVFGGTCDLQALMLAAARLGHLTMPYSNPTWWDVRSPTLSNLTRAELLGATALNSSFEPIWETYPDRPTPRSGVVMSPSAPFVRGRIAESLRSLSWNASGSAPPAEPCVEGPAAAIPSTFVFEDQVGARFPSVDFSPSEGGRGATGFAAGLLAHACDNAEVGIHTEQGFDRLARSVVGFHGSLLQYLDGGAEAPWGAMNDAWRPSPLFAASGLRASVMSFQHNLDSAAMAADVPRLCFSLAHGFHLSLDVGNAAALADVAWTRSVAAVQRIAGSRYADYSASASGEGEAPGSSVATFAADAGLVPPLDPLYSAAYNLTWDSSSTAAVSVFLPGAPSASLLARGGCAVAGSNGDADAGVYSAIFNGAALVGAGAHVIVEDATCALLATPAHPLSLCVMHPSGQDSSLTVVLPPALRALPVSQLRAAAFGADDAPIADVALAAGPSGTVSFFASAQVHGEDVLVYVVAAR